MREFRSNIADFQSRTVKRVVAELVFLVALSSFCLSEFSTALPLTLKITAVVLTVSYIAYGIFYFPKAKRLASEFSIQIDEDSLAFSDHGKMKNISYSQLSMGRMVRKNNEILEVNLITSFGQKIKLRGLDDMQGLYSALQEKIGG